MRISDWSSDVCSSDLIMSVLHKALHQRRRTPSIWQFGFHCALLAACLLISVPVASAQSRVGLEVAFRDIRSLNLTEKRALAVTLQKRLQPIVDNKIGRASCRERVCA